MGGVRTQRHTLSTTFRIVIGRLGPSYTRQTIGFGPWCWHAELCKGTASTESTPRSRLSAARFFLDCPRHICGPRIRSWLSLRSFCFSERPGHAYFWRHSTTPEPSRLCGNKSSSLPLTANKTHVERGGGAAHVLTSLARSSLADSSATSASACFFTVSSAPSSRPGSTGRCSSWTPALATRLRYAAGTKAGDAVQVARIAGRALGSATARKQHQPDMS